MTQFIKELINNTKYAPKDGLLFWREKIFQYIVLVLIIFGGLSFIIGLYISIRDNVLSIIIIDTIAYLFLLTLIFKKPIPLIIRMNLLTVMMLILGILFLFIIGPSGPGLIYMVGSNLLVAMLFGLTATYISLSFTAFLIALIYGIIRLNIFPLSAIHNYDSIEFIAVALNVLVISSIVSIPLAVLVKSLESTIRKQRHLQKMLRKSVNELSVAKLKAEESDMLKSSFLANMSHEIRTPLNAILGFSQILIDESEIEAKDRQEFTKTINESGTYLLDIIENILDISMIESKQLKYFVHCIKLKSIINDLENLYNPRIKIKEGVTIKFCISEDVKTLSINTDNQRIKQVLVNLINNAFKFTKNGEIVVECEKRNENIEFHVSDSGKGIDANHQKNIFNRFVKIQDNGFDNTEGTGLGLPISKGILEVLGGRIWVKSELGKGSTFSFSIPINQNSI